MFNFFIADFEFSCNTYLKQVFSMQSNFILPQSALTCSKLTVGTLEQGVKYVQS